MTSEQHGPADAGQPGAGRGGGFFTWLRGLGLRRSDDHWVAGVCGGIAERTGLDPLVIRGIAIVVALLGGPALIAYALAWALLPDRTGGIHLERMFHGVFEPALIAIGIIVVVSFAPFGGGLWWRGTPGWWGMPDWLEATMGAGWTILLIGGVVWLIVVIARRSSGRGTAAPQAAGTDGQAPRSHEQMWNATADTTGTTDPASAPGPNAAQGNHATQGNDAAQGDQTVPGYDAAQGDDTAQDAGPVPGDGSASGYGAAPGYGYSYGYSYGGWPQDAQARQAQQAQAHAHAQAQREQRRQADAQRRAERAARWRARQPGAAFVLISLGLAVVGGAIAAAVSLQLGWTGAAPLIGVASALAVLGGATIVSGIRGRENGILGLFTAIAVVSAVIIGAAPTGTSLSVLNDRTWSSGTDVSQTDSFVTAAGDGTLDLTSLTDSDAGKEFTAWVAAGSLEVVLPEDVPVRVAVVNVVGNVQSHGVAVPDKELSGIVTSGVIENEAAKTADESEIVTVHVRTIAGSADITTEESR